MYTYKPGAVLQEPPHAVLTDASPGRGCVDHLLIMAGFGSEIAEFRGRGRKHIL
jgi:hypothetical protein